MKVKREGHIKPWMKVHLLIFIFLTSLYLIITPGKLTSSMCVSAYKTATSLIEDGDFALERPRLETGIGKDGKYYNYEGLAFLLVVTAFLAFFSFWGHAEWLPFTNQIVTPIACLFLFFVGRELKYSTKTSILLVLIYGMGTMTMVHSGYLMPEPLTTIVYLAAFLFLLKYKNTNKRRWLLLCGCCTGTVLIVRPDAFFFLFGMLTGVLLLLYKKYCKKKKEIWLIVKEGFVFVGPLIFFFALYAYYNYARFGNIFELGYATKAQVVTEGEVKVRMLKVRSLANTFIGFAGMWIIPCRSIFFINPVLIFIFWALKDFWKKFKFESVILGLIFMLYVLLYSNRGPNGFSGSSAWGIRYMVPMISFMVIVMGVFIEKMLRSRKALYTIFIVIFVFSIGIQCIGASYSYVHTQNYLDERYNTPDDAWVARGMMNLNPRWNLITENLKGIRRGNIDLLYYTYFFRREILPDAYLQQKWMGVAPYFLLCTLFTSGYLLFKTLKIPTTEPATQKHKGKKKKHQKEL